MKRDRRSSIGSAAQTPLGRLRTALDDAERVAVSACTAADDAVAFLRACDTIDMLIDAVGAGADIRPEMNRADFLRERLRTNAGSIVQTVRRTGRDHDLRESPSWKQALTIAADARARRLRRMALVGAGAAVVIALLVFLPMIFPAEPAPDTASIGRLLIDREVAAALDLARAEYERFPDNPEAALWRGVLELRAGDPLVAEELFAQARRQASSEVGFLFERGNLLIQAGLPDAAEVDAAALIARSDAQAEGYLLLGSVREVRGDREGAIAAFQQAADLAAAANKPQLEVIAKTRLGMILQSPPLNVER
ncbi:MAG: tetratricopeptide repeat protein [Roseiflexus sp.]